MLLQCLVSLLLSTLLEILHRFDYLYCLSTYACALLSIVEAMNEWTAQNSLVYGTNTTMRDV